MLIHCKSKLDSREGQESLSTANRWTQYVLFCSEHQSLKLRHGQGHTHLVDSGKGLLLLLSLVSGSPRILYRSCVFHMDTQHRIRVHSGDTEERL